MKTTKDGQVSSIARPPTTKQPKRDNFMGTSNQEQLTHALSGLKNEQRNSIDDENELERSPGGYHSQDEASNAGKRNKKRQVMIVGEDEESEEAHYKDGKTSSNEQRKVSQ